MISDTDTDLSDHYGLELEFVIPYTLEPIGGMNQTKPVMIPKDMKQIG